MAKLITIDNPVLSNLNQSKEYCRGLEEGNILFFPKICFNFPKEDIEFLLTQKQSNASNRKNIAYKPGKDIITNFEKGTSAAERLLKVMRNYSNEVQSFLSKLVMPYAPYWKIDFASFRPFQEKGRSLRTRARNDLLHVDAFPTRPMHGNRILRFFTNINPTEKREWITSDPFEVLLEKYGKEVGLPKKVDYSYKHILVRMLKKQGKSLGLPLILRSPYDDFMLRFHNYLKENQEFQKNCRKDPWGFPPNSCWMVYTDLVSHAALAGQYAIEQTFLIPRAGLLFPEKAPVSVLEIATGYSAINNEYALA